MNRAPYRVVHDGAYAELGTTELGPLLAEGVVYQCPECPAEDGQVVYHLSPGRALADLFDCLKRHGF